MTQDPRKLNSTLPREQRAWALRTLHLDEAAGPADAVVVLRVVEQCGYAVPLKSANAIHVLIHGVELEAVSRWNREQQMSEMVGQFAGSFFQQHPGERVRLWETLRADCDIFPRLRNWLEKLQPGLVIRHLPVSDSDDVNDLVQICCRIFVAPEPERTRAQQGFHSTYQHDAHKWRSAAAQLAGEAPEFMNLVGRFFGELMVRQESHRPIETTAKWNRFSTALDDAQYRARRFAAEESKAQAERVRLRAAFAIGIAILSVLFAASKGEPPRRDREFPRQIRDRVDQFARESPDPLIKKRSTEELIEFMKKNRVLQLDDPAIRSPSEIPTPPLFGQPPDATPSDRNGSQ